jgi:hypothetical protein
LMLRMTPHTHPVFLWVSSSSALPAPSCRACKRKRSCHMRMNERVSDSTLSAGVCVCVCVCVCVRACVCVCVCVCVCRSTHVPIYRIIRQTAHKFHIVWTNQPDQLELQSTSLRDQRRLVDLTWVAKSSITTTVRTASSRVLLLVVSSRKSTHSSPSLIIANRSCTGVAISADECRVRMGETTAVDAAHKFAV